MCNSANLKLEAAITKRRPRQKMNWDNPGSKKPNLLWVIQG